MTITVTRLVHPRCGGVVFCGHHHSCERHAECESILAANLANYGYITNRAEWNGKLYYVVSCANEVPFAALALSISAYEGIAIVGLEGFAALLRDRYCREDIDRFDDVQRRLSLYRRVGNGSMDDFDHIPLLRKPGGSFSEAYASWRDLATLQWPPASRCFLCRRRTASLWRATNSKWVAGRMKMDFVMGCSHSDGDQESCWEKLCRRDANVWKALPLRRHARDTELAAIRQAKATLREIRKIIRRPSQSPAKESQPAETSRDSCHP